MGSSKCVVAFVSPLREASERAMNGKDSLLQSRGDTIPEESRFTIPVFGESCH